MTKQVELNGYEFCVEEKGKGKKVIFIHGSASDYRTWGNCINKFSADFHAISYSRRYHWPNEKIAPGEDYSMQEHVEDLKSMINYFTDHHEAVDLVGHSYGALLCLELATRYPDIVNRMILSEPPAIRLFVSNSPKPLELFKLLLQRPKTALALIKLGAKGLGPATRYAQDGEMDKVVELFGRTVLGKHTFDELSEERKSIVKENTMATEFTGSGFLPLTDSKLEQMQIPILLLSGARSPKIFRYLSNRLDELLPESSHKQIKDASHIIHEDNEADFIQVAISFLK